MRFRVNPRLLPYGLGVLATVCLTAVVTGLALGDAPASGWTVLFAFAGLALGAVAWRLWRRTAGDAREAGRRGGALSELIRTAAEDSAVGVMIATWDGVGMYASRQFRDLLFLPAGQDSEGVHDLLDILEGSLDSQGRSRENFRRLREIAGRGEAGAEEVICRRRDGKPAWRRLSAEPFGDATGSGVARYVHWRVRDITEEKRQTSARQAAEARRADLLDGLPAGCFSVDGQGRIIYANRQLAAWLGVERTALRGRPFAEFVVDGNPGRETDNGETGEVTLKTASGETFTALLLQNHRETTDGDLVYTRSFLLREMAWAGEGGAVPSAGDEEAPGMGRRLRSLFDDGPVAIALVDTQTRVVDCNRAFGNLSGVHRDMIVGRPFAERLAADCRDSVAAVLAEVTSGRRFSAQTDVRLSTPGGGQTTASLFASRMEDDHGRIGGVVLHFIDTTEQKSLELQFAQSQKMQAVGQLAGGVAHDFNNLLTAMIGFTDLLLERHGPGDPSFNDLQQIKQNANRATNLVRQLLAFSRKQNLEPDVLDPRDALDDLSNLLRRLLGETVRLKLEGERDAGKILADRGQFDQVIINLAVNARDAMPDGGPLVIRTLRQDLEQAEQHRGEIIPAGAYVVVEVVDEGTGMDKQTLDRIFEPFFSTKEVGQGTGLGLSTVYGIIHQSGGYVGVESAPGEGTTFRLYFPRAEEAAPSVAAPAVTAKAAADGAKGKAEKGGKGEKAEPELPLFEADLTGSETILLVEDEDAVRMFGARALRNKGYKVLEAQNGEAALDIITGTDRHIDLVISDVIMPGMDGYSLVGEIRRRLPDIKVILMSGYAEDAFQDEIDRDETIHFLPKPFTLKTLVGKVKEIVVGERPEGGPPPA